MNNIPVITGDRYDGLKEELNGDLQQPFDFFMIQSEIRHILTAIVSALYKLATNFNMELLNTKELISVAIFFGAVSMLQVYLALT